LVNKILLDAIESGASDIHLTPEKGSLKVKVRVDGMLKELLEVPGNLSAPVVSRIKLLGGMDISEKRRPQDGRLRVEFSGTTKDLRLSSIPSLHGENIVARILSPELGDVTFESLGMPPEVCKNLREDLTGSSRVILVTGPTGSGKTSTLYAAIAELKLQGLNIITIEDPIEYRVPGILQTQVNPKIGLNFADGLRSILRQDPDVVVVGEIRDAETANIVMQVAQTGHLVLSTLHTNSAASAITRLCDLGVAPFMIASSIQSIMAQRLVRRSKEDKSGYSGRIGVYSYLQMSERLREAVRSSQGEANFETIATERGFQSLTQAAERLISCGATTLEEAERVFGTKSSWSISATTQPQKKTSLKRRVLVVEDDENMRMILNMLLSRALYDVVEACDGRAALESILSNPPDLVVTDLMMPELDGADLVAIMKRDPRTSMIPVLLLTAVASEETELKLLSCGADDFVSKTTDQKILLARVEKLINRSVAH
jgi:type II secretory ATPase GspE/PulE/Tfp pilus assembly ATPase PilB-like protein/ActR/RegA family two-component response regulator